MTTITALTYSALEKLASGVASNFAGTGLFKQIVKEQNATLQLFYTTNDNDDDPLVLIQNTDGESTLPQVLRLHQRPIFHRILSFVQRAKNMPIAIPSGWKPYRHDDLIAFFVAPTGLALAGSPRWVSQVRLGGTQDIALWELTTTDDKQALAKFQPPTDTHEFVRDNWQSHLRSSLLAMQGPTAQNSTGVEVVLDEPMPDENSSGPRTVTEWLPRLTPSQTEFVEARVDRSIRLRGPAGSGKTLTMAIKAVREAQSAKESGNDIQILFVTHSWSLAGEVDEIIGSLSEYGHLDNITVLPLIAVAQEILPAGMSAEGLKLIGDDSLTGKFLQLEQIREVVEEFKRTDWITFEHATSGEFRKRINSEDAEDIGGLAWDLLIEFGCVLGADGIFPGFNAEARYLRLPRAPWMMGLQSEGDKRVVYYLYERFWQALNERNLVTSDQLLNDFLNYLETFSWNHRRQNEGFDQIFVDEFHLFNVQERQTLRYLSRDTRSYPKIFMALDPRQSPWEAYVGTSVVGVSSSQDDDMDSIQTVDIPTVHRLTPEVLELVKHVHLDFPNLDLGADWQIPISEVESLSHTGPRPSLYLSNTQHDEEMEIYGKIREIYPSCHSGAQFALAIVDESRFPKYMQLMESVAASGKYRVVTITNREDVGLLKQHRKGIVFGPAEYLAGLQFDTVLVAGLPDMNTSSANQSYRRRRHLSLLYLALSRASRDIRIFANEDDGGVPEVFSRAKELGSLGIFKSPF